jgi:hypothetical protein
LKQTKKIKTAELVRQQSTFDKAKEQLDSIEIDLGNIKDILPTLEKERDELKAKNDKFNQADNWLKVYNSLNAVKRKFELQRRLSSKGKKLKSLNGFLKSKKSSFHCLRNRNTQKESNQRLNFIKTRGRI